MDSRILKISNAGLGYVRYAHLSKPHIRNAVNVLIKRLKGVRFILRQTVNKTANKNS